MLALLALAAAAACGGAPARAQTTSWYPGAAGRAPLGTLDGAVSGDLGAPLDGDWCNLYDAPGSCSAAGGVWTVSFDARAPQCAQSAPAWCGAQHYVALAGAGVLPWRIAWMQEPALEVADEAELEAVAAARPAWAYLCPLLKAPGQPYYLEYCLEQWHAPGAPAQSSLADRSGQVASCAPVTVAGVASAIDTIVAPFVPAGVSPYVEELPGSAATAAGPRLRRARFAARITLAELRSAIAADNAPADPRHPGSPGPTEGCRRGLAEDASAYQLVGVEQGIESLPGARIAATLANLELATTTTGPQPQALLPAVAW